MNIENYNTDLSDHPTTDVFVFPEPDPVAPRRWAIAASIGALVTASGILIAGAPSKASASDPSQPVPVAARGTASSSIELAFITHLDAGMPEQDVFIERRPGSGEVFRVTTGDHDMMAPLFKATTELPHNPFDPAANGPYPKGEALGMTLGEWLRHSGTGTYRYQDGSGTLELDLQNLVPGGVYTIWYAFMPVTPPEPFTGTLDLPLGAPDGTESGFRADASGRARFTHSFRPGLQMSDVWTTAVLAIAYHSDGKTHGGSAGEFGKHTHVPLFTMLPEREGIE